MSCQQRQSADRAISLNDKSLSCHTTAVTLRGKEFLNDKYLKKIDAITPNLAKSADMGGMVAIKGGKFSMGGDHAKEFEGMPSTALAQADEFPKHEVQVSDFWMDDHEVTVGEFREFVNATGYITVAEQDVDRDELKKQLLTAYRGPLKRKQYNNKIDNAILAAMLPELSKSRPVFSTDVLAVQNKEYVWVPRGLTYQLLPLTKVPSEKEYVQLAQHDLSIMHIPYRERLQPSEQNLITPNIPRLYSYAVLAAGDSFYIA